MAALEVRDPDVRINAIKMMQRKAGIPVTGVVDAATIDVLSRPRCGVPDISNGPGSYQVRKPWQKKSLTYRYVMVLLLLLLFLPLA